jgi:hypothetical protein
MAHTLPKVILLALSIVGFWTLWGFPYQNGLLGILKQQTEPGAFIPSATAAVKQVYGGVFREDLDPAASAPMKQVYTGVGPVDRQLTTLVSFFYTAVDGNRADVSILFSALGGQVLAAWVLINIEALRAGNQGRFILTA